MADDGAILLSPETYDRFDEAAGKVLGTGRAPRQRRPQSGATDETYLVKMTDTTPDASGHYPGTVQLYDAGADTYTDGGSAVIHPNGVTPTLDFVYTTKMLGYRSDGECVHAAMSSSFSANVAQGQVAYGSFSPSYDLEGDAYFTVNRATGVMYLAAEGVGTYDTQIGPGYLWFAQSPHYTWFQNGSDNGTWFIAGGNIVDGIRNVVSFTHASGVFLIQNTNRTRGEVCISINDASGQVFGGTSTIAGMAFVGGILTGGVFTGVSATTGFATTQKFGAPR